MSILKWLGLSGEDVPDDNQLHEIEKALEAHGPERARYLACFAYILTRAAKADHHVSDAEAALMEQIVAERAGVDAEQAALIVRIARQAGHSRGTDDYLIAREFERVASREEKLKLLDCLFAIAAVDASIKTVEDNEVRRVASELKLEHADYIEVRKRHLGSLNVLRREGQ
ncbi:MAG: TerB family tellurite resistance protein [Acidobacteriota bacterium]|nr:TerB family tellurite resistance protein [Acidobacteriota bacterium]MDQ3420520.1 TerB family tellurite resistance protein [Acidobacteriota bacterium]